MEKNEFIKKIEEGLAQNYTFTEFRDILIQFKEEGGTQEDAYNLLHNMALKNDYYQDDLFDILDIVSGWCRYDLRVF
ncbi:MAG: hypothetical protein JNL70_10250 [Saprospiraceae bacterium]|nr:hypothetical protein [Saprospiraceae bacterium]